MNEELINIFDGVFKLKQEDVLICPTYHHKWYDLEIRINKRIMSEVKDLEGNSVFELSYACSLNNQNSELLIFKEEQLFKN